jgi:hypothetical protein
MIPKRVHLGYQTKAGLPGERREKVVIASCGIYRDGRKVTTDKRKVTCAICLQTNAPSGRKPLPRGTKPSYQELRHALRAIHTAVRGDAKSEYWTLRRYLDKRKVFHDDLGDGDRLIEAVCKAALRIP